MLEIIADGVHLHPDIVRIAASAAASSRVASSAAWPADSSSIVMVQEMPVSAQAFSMAR